MRRRLLLLLLLLVMVVVLVVVTLVVTSLLHHLHVILCNLTTDVEPRGAPWPKLVLATVFTV